jgi:hypothetical protein
VRGALTAAPGTSARIDGFGRTHAAAAAQVDAPPFAVALAHAHDHAAPVVGRFRRNHQHRGVFARKQAHASGFGVVAPSRFQGADRRAGRRGERVGDVVFAAIGLRIGPDRRTQE